MKRLHKRIIRESRIPTRTISSIAERFKEIVQHDPYPTTKKFSGYVILERNLNSEDEWFDWGYLFDNESQASTYLSNNLDSENDIENYDIVKVSFTLTKDFA